MYWYMRASSRGHASAAHNIGTIYRDKGDFTNARRWFLSAIKKGNFSSAIEIAKIYMTRQQTAKVKQFLTLALSHPESLSEHDADEARELLHGSKARSHVGRRNGR
jgi:TPR repeat protein